MSELLIKNIDNVDGKIYLTFSSGDTCVISRSDLNIISRLLMEMYTSRGCAATWKPKRNEQEKVD